ncbi:PqiC family protein [Simiduia curdlanivorans]|uniref:Membrane integrity-associated transporter subunit PqiC n=1 Tax=Simiduia curdlanivorans TaxID=1492769 RepID=A0ABV8V1K3_9GAMM|nr:PqiC family protein [Simiduia curdlanivorans]MDN3637584.1 PqiC family protein [Simiduia curdlanivorans]
MKTVFILLLACVALSSCKSVAPKTFYLLGDSQWLAPAPEAEVNVLVGIGPIELAGFLNRPQLVYQGQDGAIHVATGHVWAEPLEKGVARTLGMKLTAQNPARAFVYFPWRQDSKPEKSVRVQIHNIFRAAETVGLQATWVVVVAGADGAMTYHHFNKQVSAKPDSEGLVDGLNQLLSLLAEDVDKAL